MISVTLADWAEQHHVLLEFIKPGRPMQNGFIELFNRSYREAVLDMFCLSKLVGSARTNRTVAEGVQRRTTTQVSGPSDAPGIFVNQKTGNL